MKPTTYYKVLPSGVPVVTDHKGLWDNLIPLYTAHEIADFVKGLYFDDNFHLETGHTKTSVFAQIADKIESEAAKGDM